MAVSVRIEKPLSLEAICTRLGVPKITTSHGQAYDVAYLCSNLHGKINPGALYKPVRYVGPAQVAGYYKAQDNGYGFNLKKILFDSPSLLLTALQNNAAGYEYQPPVPGNAERHFSRLTDFEGYHHGATKAWTVPQDTTVNANNPGGVPWGEFDATDTFSPYMIAEAKGFAAKYYGVIAWRATGLPKSFIVTNTKTTETGTVSLVGLQNAYAGTWNAALFISEVPVKVGEEATVNGGRALLCSEVRQLTVVVGSGLSVTLNGKFESNKVRYELILENNTTMPVTINSVKVFASLKSGGVGQPEPQGLAAELGTINIPANGKETRTGLVNPAWLSQTGSVYVGGSYTYNGNSTALNNVYVGEVVDGQQQ